MNKKLIIFGLFAIALAISGFIIAETSDLEIELSNLVSDLEAGNYSWLVDYAVEYPNVEVYEENSELKIADFGIIGENKKYQVFLNGLGNKTQNIFDLKILGGSVVFDYIVDPIILGNANSVNTNTTYENNFTHLNVSNSSIVAYFPFDDNASATTVYDYTNNSNDGTISGAVYNTSQAIYGGAMTFDGVNDVVNINPVLTNNLATTTKGTWSAWVKVVDATDETQMFIGFGDTDGFGGLGVYVRSSRVVEFFGFKTTSDWVKATTNPVINSGQWHHVALTYAPLDATIYIDGVAVAQSYRISTNKDVWFANVSGLDNGRIGANNRNGAGDASFFNGSIDEVMIWNIALNSTEVLAIYNNQTARFHGTGEMNYTGVNFAGNDTINITLAGCQQNIGTSLRAKVNNGAYVNFSSGCTIQDYNATGNLNSANVTIGFVSDANRFYTPLVIGNLSLDSRDVIVPNLTINFPTNNSFSSVTNLSVNFTAQSQDLNTCWYSNDSYTANTTLANCVNITTVQWAEGQHNLTIWVNDTANSVNSSMVTFTIDTTLPTFAWENPTPTDKISISSNSTYLNATITDVTQTSAWFDWNKSLVGYWPMDFRNSTGVYDNSSNENFGTATGGAVYNSSGFYGGAMTFNGSSYIKVFNGKMRNDNVGTVSVWYRSLGGTNDYIYSQGGASNEIIGFRAIVTSGVRNMGFVTIYPPNQIKSNLIGNTALANNTWYHLAWSSDGSTNKMYVDGVLQTITVLGGQNRGDWFDNVTSGDPQESDIGAGKYGGAYIYSSADIDEVMIWDRVLSTTEILALYNNTANRLQNNFTSLSDATYNYSAYSIDKAGNLNITSPDRQITVDTTFPTWSANETNLTSSTLNGKGVYFNITLTETNPNTYIFSWYNGTAWENTTSSYTNAQEVSITKTINIDIATINWTWYINDSANNLNQTDIWSVTLLADDNVPPNISFANPTTNATNLSQNFIFANLSFADATSPISMANISLFNSTQNIINSTQGTTSTLEINFTGLADGTYYLNASVNDSLGNRNQTETRIIRLDTTFPTLSFASPTTNTSNLSQSFIQANLSFTETNLNVTNITLFNSTGNPINSTTGTTSPLYINFSGLSDGRYYLNATISDTSGNKNQTETRNIGLDRVAPNLTINSPTSGTYETSTILFNATSLDATTLVDSCWYTTNSGTTNRTLSKAGTSNSYNFTQTSISDSTYTARFYCNDSANNINNTQTIAFTINTFVPAGGGPAPAAAGGAGGGASSKPSLKRIFNLEYNMYDQTISLNQVEFDKLQITNNGETADEYNIEVKTIDNIISFEEKKIKLAPGETKALEFKISSPKEPGIYTGKIIVSNGISEREVLTTINVKTEKSLFDITLTIPESLKTLLIGQNLISKIDLIQMGLKENIDVTLNYAIKDFEGQTYLSESETIAVLDQKSYEKEFFTGELPPGQYVLGTELIHPDGVAVASTHFVVQERGVKFGKSEILLTSLILVLVLISLVLFLSIRKYKRIGKTLKKGDK